MRFSIRSNIRDVERDLSDAARRQVPFATSIAINDTAEDIRRNESKRLGRVLDRPTPFTRRAFRVRRSSKRRLTATVFAMRIQAQYLATLEEGGERRPKGRALVVPASIRLNQYGNIPRGSVKRTIAKPTTFSGTPKGGRGGPGIYQRTGENKRLVKLVSYAHRSRYRPMLKFKSSAMKTTARRLPYHFDRAMRRAWSARK